MSNGMRTNGWSWLRVTFALLLTCAAPSKSSAAERAQSPPVLWTPSAIASGDYESTPAFTPNGETMIFMRGNRAFDRYWLLQTRCGKQGWSAPEAVEFRSDPAFSDADPFITADGKRLYFVSTRTFDGKQGDDFDIWFVDREGAGWSEPERLPEPVNSPQTELLPRVTLAGEIYFGSDRPGGVGDNDIYRATSSANGEWRVENLGEPVNTASKEFEAEISQDGRKLVVVSNRDVRSHLYVYDWREGAWQFDKRIAADDSVFQVGPVLSPSGDRLLFAQASGDASGEMFVVDLATSVSDRWPPACPTPDVQ